MTILSTLFLTENAYQRVVKSSLDSFKNSNDQFVIFSYDHDSHYRSSFKMIKDNFPLGIGPKLFREECKKEIYNINEKSCSTHPHNYFIQLVLEIGILDFFVVTFYSYLLLNFLKIIFCSKKIHKK